MTTIKTSCALCGDVELQPHQVQLHIYENALDRSYFEFFHEMCQDTVFKEASPEAINLLLTTVRAGLLVDRVVIPAEALQEHVGWIITSDEVLDFTLDLEKTDYLTEMLVRA